MIVYHTENSQYVIDTEKLQYMRHPGDILQSVFSHRLTYGEWHPLKSIPKVWATDEGDVLHIMREDSTHGILTTPIVRQYEI